ncbi:hypothetical protein GGU10DRAFT_354051 [Lentinula aff. detonsa]|uniref:Uncharacterized protein n=1 Tax=Lentinula aff. detonsa TaxID=2804958 RepID=A0AA38NM04_9AGAR|nr:hypothetical protein GGU10DRAFT_354051 [Lentinula aff. detonsa]
MLARPRPPAQVRRASKENSTFTFPSEDDNSTNLPELLSRADGLIRERERELSFTSELSRELKQTHEAFVARTPLTSPSSFHATPLPQSPQGHSRNITTSTLYQSLHALHSSQSQALSPSSSFGPPLPATSRHTRRISITQSELARLSDQNAELLQKLEQLEEESTSADKAGRRRLGKLEREIQTLRDELDQARMQTRLDEADAGTSSKLNKEEKMQRRRKINNEESSPTFQDFAPSTSSSVLSLSQSSKSSSATYSTENSSSTTVLHHLLSKISELEEANVQICKEQHETSSRLRDAQSQVESMRKVWSSLGLSPGLNGEEEDIDVQIIADHLQDVSLEEGSDRKQGTIRSLRSLRSINLDFESGINGGMHSTLKVPSNLAGSSDYSSRFSSFKGKSKGRKSVVGLFAKDEDKGKIISDSLNLEDGFSRIRHSTDSNAMFSPTAELSELDLSVSLTHSRSQSFDVDVLTSDDDDGTHLLGVSRRRTLGSEIGDLGDSNPNPFSGSSYLRSRNNSLIQEIEGHSFDFELSQSDISPVNIQECSESGTVDLKEDREDTQKYRIAPSNASIRITPPTPDSKQTSSSPFPSLPNASSTSFKFTSSSISTATAQSTPQTLTEPKLKLKLKADPESIRARRISLSQSVKARAGRWGPRLSPRLSDIFQAAREVSANDQDGRSKSESQDTEPDNGRGGFREEISARLSEGFGSVFGRSLFRDDDDVKSKSSVGSLRTNSRRRSTHSSSSSRRGQYQSLSSHPSVASGSKSHSTAGAIVVRPAFTTALSSSSSSVQRVRSLVLEAWLWLQLLVVLGVFIWAVARKGPRGVLMPVENHNVKEGRGWCKERNMNWDASNLPTNTI